MCCATSVHCSSLAFDTCVFCGWFLVWQSPDCLSQLQVEVRLRVIHYSKTILGSCSQASSAKVIVPAPPPPNQNVWSSPLDMTIQRHVTCQFLARLILLLITLCKECKGSIVSFSMVLRLDLHSVVLSHASAAIMPSCGVASRHRHLCCLTSQCIPHNRAILF